MLELFTAVGVAVKQLLGKFCAFPSHVTTSERDAQASCDDHHSTRECVQQARSGQQAYKDGRPAPELHPDCLRKIMRGMNCVELARVALVCRTWHAAAVSSDLWRHACEQELGPCMPAFEPADWYQHFVAEKHSGGIQFASLCARFASALKAVTGFKLVLHAHTAAPELSTQLPEQEAAAVKPTTVFCTGQSIWLQFLLPYSNVSMDLQVVADVGEQGSICLLDSRMFQVAASARDRMWKRQLEGLEALAAHGQMFENGLHGPSWLMVYIHQEQLLRKWPFQVPQVFPTPLYPCKEFRSWTTIGVQMFIEFCSDHGCLGVLRTSVLAPAGMDLLPHQIGIKFEAKLSSVEEVSMTARTGPHGCLDPALRVPMLSAALHNNCLANITILDDRGCLLLGRAGLVWEAEEEDHPRAWLSPVVTYRSQFALNEAANCNFVTIRPAAELIGLSICPRAAFEFGWCS